jgi:thymidylate synthase ThyX
MNKIIVKLNPDTPPAGTDLSVVNAARRSFNTRSDWDTAILSHQEFEENKSKYSDWQLVDSFYEPYAGYELRKLKDKDKRLIEFLARGMTTDDFEQFKLNAGGKGLDWLYYMDNNKEQELIDLLWQWRNTPTHDTPFNHTFISFEVKAPIFVRAQLV